MQSLVVIPARFNAVRFPGKPLKDVTGKSLVQHVYERALQSKANRIIVATDDPRIIDIVEQFGGEAMMTKASHKSGTDRVAEVASRLTDFEVIVNVQGDEPEIEPEAINKLIQIQQEHNPFMSTLCCQFPADNLEGQGSPLDPTCNKVVLGKEVAPETKHAIYFSRNFIPYPKATNGIIKHPENYYLHIGMYAYSPDSIQEFSNLPRGFLEQTEGLEQLRVLENGYNIIVGIIDHAFPGVDTREDYQAFVERWNKQK